MRNRGTIEASDEDIGRFSIMSPINLVPGDAVINKLVDNCSLKMCRGKEKPVAFAAGYRFPVLGEDGKAQCTPYLDREFDFNAGRSDIAHHVPAWLIDVHTLLYNDHEGPLYWKTMCCFAPQTCKSNKKPQGKAKCARCERPVHRICKKRLRIVNGQKICTRCRTAGCDENKSE